MTISTEFSVEFPRPPRVNAMGMLEDQEPEERTFVVEWSVTPGEQGRVSPSHPASPAVDRVVDAVTGEECHDDTVFAHAVDAAEAAFIAGP